MLCRRRLTRAQRRALWIALWHRLRRIGHGNARSIGQRRRYIVPPRIGASARWPL